MSDAWYPAVWFFGLGVALLVLWGSGRVGPPVLPAAAGLMVLPLLVPSRRARAEPPSATDRLLAQARDAYAAGRFDVEQLEGCLESILAPVYETTSRLPLSFWFGPVVVSELAHDDPRYRETPGFDRGLASLRDRFDESYLRRRGELPDTLRPGERVTNRYVEASPYRLVDPHTGADFGVPTAWAAEHERWRRRLSARLAADTLAFTDSVARVARLPYVAPGFRPGDEYPPVCRDPGKTVRE